MNSGLSFDVRESFDFVSFLFPFEKSHLRSKYALPPCLGSFYPFSIIPH